MKKGLGQIIKYLDELTLEYGQICQRSDGSIYGIASGKQCRQGKPISFNPNNPRLANNASSKQVKDKDKDKVKSIVAKAKAIGLNEKEIRGIKSEVKEELQVDEIQGKEALKLFAKKANQLAKEKKANSLGDSKSKGSSLVKPSGQDYRDYISAGEENHKEILSKLRKIKEEHDRLTSIYESYFSKGVKFFRSSKVSKEEALQALEGKNKLIKESSSFLKELRLKYLSRGDKDKAKESAEYVVYSSFGLSDYEFYRGIFYNLNRFTNNTVKSLGWLEYTDSRASTNKPASINAQSSINVGDQEGGKTFTLYAMWHEFGHHVEFSNPDLLPAMKSWIRSRSAGVTEKLSDLTGDLSYEDDEVAWVGNFGLGPYVGKDYEDSTEVISMGLEHFATPAKMYEFYMADPEHFTLILGVLDSL